MMEHPELIRKHIFDSYVVFNKNTICEFIKRLQILHKTFNVRNNKNLTDLEVERMNEWMNEWMNFIEHSPEWFFSDQ